MRKVAGTLKLELSQYRDLEAFSQFGSDLDADTKRALARGERLVTTLNQNERHPMPVEEQVVQIFAATNGYLDRINVDRVPEFLEGLAESIRGNEPELMKTIAGGDWSDETQSKLEDAVAQYTEDFGYDLDEEGLPLEEDEAQASARRRATTSGPGGVGNRQAKRRWPSARMARSETFATASTRSRTSRRSRARWRWSPPRGCAGPSSGSRRCGRTRTRSGA